MTLEEMDHQRSTLVIDLQAIEAQLSQKRKFDAQGRMWPLTHFQRWRLSVIATKTELAKRLIQINEQIKTARRLESKPIDALDLSTVDGLLAGALKTLRRFATEFEVTPREQAVIDGIADYINHKRPVTTTATTKEA